MPALSQPPLGGGTGFFALAYEADGPLLWLLEQRRLPQSHDYLACRSAAEVAAAICAMVVRGAPAIGIAAAYGLALSAAGQCEGAEAFLRTIAADRRALAATRPTAVNLGWALARMFRHAETCAHESPAVRAARMREEAAAIHLEDLQACRTIGTRGSAWIAPGATVLTHCNTGALATGGHGTALGMIRSAHEAGKGIQVLACETRPYLQGARLTAWELHQDCIPVTVITDSMAAHFMRQGAIDCVVVGSDRIAANGDVANKIGTYALAVLAQAHQIPLYVAAPCSTIDLDTQSGADIPIEARPATEVACMAGQRLVPEGVDCHHPAFDITPAALITAICTERGAIYPPQGDRPEKLWHPG